MLLCVCAQVHLGGWWRSVTRQNDIPPFVSAFLRQLHSFCVTGAAAGIAEEQEVDEGAARMGERGPGEALNRPTKAKKMV